MAFRYATEKEQEKRFQKVMNVARGWYAKGFKIDQILHGVRNAGYLQSEAKKGSTDTIVIDRPLPNSHRTYSTEVKLSE